LGKIGASDEEDEVKGCLLRICSLVSMPREKGRGRAAVARGGFREERGGALAPYHHKHFFCKSP